MAWNLTKQKIIKRALRLVGAVPQGDSPTPEQVSEASEALNALMKSFVFGTKLWKVRTYTRRLETTTTQVIGTDGKRYDCRKGHLSSSVNQPGSGQEFNEYWVEVETDGSAGTTWAANTQYKNIGDILLNEATLDVTNVAYRNTEDNAATDDEPIEIIDGDVYFNIDDKDETDTTPTCAWIDKQIQQRLFIYKKAEATTDYILVIKAEEVVDDLINADANPDFNVKYIDLICFGLAMRIAPEYGLPLTERASLKAEFNELMGLLKLDEKETDDDQRLEPAF